MTKSTNKAICNNGNIARKIEFNTICRPLHKKNTILILLNFNNNSNNKTNNNIFLPKYMQPNK
jgi:hypothetical protein